MKKNTGFFKESFEKIRFELMEMYEYLFIEKIPKIQKEWLYYISDLDKRLSKALKTSVKASLLEL